MIRLTPMYPELEYDRPALRIMRDLVSSLEEAEDFDDEDDREDTYEQAVDRAASEIETIAGDAYYQGAAVVFGLIGMAEAVASNESVRACPSCGLARGSRVYLNGVGNPWDRTWICFPCYRAGMPKESTEE